MRQVCLSRLVLVVDSWLTYAQSSDEVYQAGHGIPSFFDWTSSFSSFATLYFDRPFAPALVFVVDKMANPTAATSESIKWYQGWNVPYLEICLVSADGYRFRVCANRLANAR